MKTLVVSGSPRMSGDSMTLANEMIRHLDGEVHIVHTYYDNISPCVDCRYCWSNVGCAIDDRMQDVYELLNEVDNVVMVSPLHFSALAGKLLSFASRLQTLYASRFIRHGTEHKLKRKRGALVISAGGRIKYPEMATALAHSIFQSMNVHSIGNVLSLHTDEIPAGEDASAMNEARRIALQLNELHKSQEGAPVG